MSKVVSIKGDRVPELGSVNQSLVEALEDALAFARDGRLQCLIATGFLADGLRFSIWTDAHPNVYEMLGSIAWLEHEYVQRQTEKTPITD